jgi:hypothetical protein
MVCAMRLIHVFEASDRNGAPAWVLYPARGTRRPKVDQSFNSIE